MKKPFGKFSENIRLALSDEAARARRQAELDDPDYVPRVVQWRDDPDPFGMDWSWAAPPEGEKEMTVADKAPPPSDQVVPFNPPASSRSSFDRLARRLGPAIAASLIIGAGTFLLGTRMQVGEGGREVLLGRVGVRGDATRGIGDVAIDVTNGGDRRAFVTVVGLDPERRRAAIHYRSVGRYLVTPPGETTTIANLPPEFEGSTVALVVVTDVPAGEAVRLGLGENARAADSAELVEKLRRDLESLNIRAQIKAVPFSTGEK